MSYLSHFNLQEQPFRLTPDPDGQPVMLAEPVRAKVFAFDSTGKPVPSSNKVVLPAGWYVLPRKLTTSSS